MPGAGGSGWFSPGYVPARYVTQDIPGIGGRLKERPEDFLVDEIPLYTPCGEGEHIYLTLQKRLLSTYEMVAVVASHFGVRRKDVGYAGLKDKHAVTRQTVSIYAPGKRAEHFPELRHDGLQMLGVAYHANKLRPGHLRGNRFSIRIRGVRPTDAVTAKAVLERLRETGVPNRVGEQRFGLIENNHLVGAAIVRGDWEGAVRELLGPSERFPQVNAEARRLFAAGKLQEALRAFPYQARVELIVLNALSQGASPARAMNALDDTFIGYYLSAFQSAVFNAVLDERVEAGALGVLEAGDVAMKHVNQAVFSVTPSVLEEPATRERLKSFEISPSGPMWGGGMKRATGATDAREVRALSAAGVTPEMMEPTKSRASSLVDGKRRPLRVPLVDPEVEGGVDEHGAYVRIAFELPRGSFATVVAREIMKPLNPKIAGPPDEPEG